MKKRNISDQSRRLLRVCGVMAIFLVSTSAWGEGDPGRGWARARMCAGCHGIPDYRTAFPEVYAVPKLGGQEPAYIVKKLQEYKSGVRKHPTMTGIAATLSDQDMADLAAYYDTSKDATHKERAAPPATGAVPASNDPVKSRADLTCGVCHGPEGNRPSSPETPRIAGQQYDYLVQVLIEYRHGTRQNPIMSAVAQQMVGDKEIRELAAYFSRQEGLTAKR